MADVLCTALFLRISDVGCGFTRRALLALEPGARVWLRVEGTSMLFERMRDVDGQSDRRLQPVGGDAVNWRALVADTPTVLEIEFVERPQDAGRGVDRWGTEAE